MVNMFINNNNNNNGNNRNTGRPNSPSRSVINPMGGNGTAKASQRFAVHIYKAGTSLASSLRLPDILAPEPRVLKAAVDITIRAYVQKNFTPKECGTLAIGNMQQVTQGVFEIQFKIVNAYYNAPTFFIVSLKAY